MSAIKERGRVWGNRGELKKERENRVGRERGIVGEGEWEREESVTVGEGEWGKREGECVTKIEGKDIEKELEQEWREYGIVRESWGERGIVEEGERESGREKERENGDRGRVGESEYGRVGKK